MSKAVLVIDMPECCAECPLFHGHHADMNCGALENRTINYPYPDDDRQDWCPLKPLPEKARFDAFDTVSQIAWVRGWNAFRDKITKVVKK